MQKFSCQEDRSLHAYIFFACFFSVIIVISNCVGLKFIPLPFYPDFPLAIGALSYPLSFLLTDIVSEIWGEKRANWMVYCGFAMSLFTMAFIQLAVSLPPHSAWYNPNNSFSYTKLEDFQQAYESVFHANITRFVASTLAYMTAQLIDIRIFHFIKSLTGNKHLWLRNNLSTLLSQLVDTAIVGSIIYYYGLEMDFFVGLKVMCVLYIYKAIFALIDTPFVYLGVALTRHIIKI